VCDEAKLKTPKKRKIDKSILSYIADKPELSNCGEDVTLTISSNLLRLVNSETNVLIGEYDMPKISFASGGDTDTLDFVAFVAKTSNDWRACYVLECVGGYASEIISTIGDAFELRYNQHLSSGAE
jgi:SHC-transforming protein 1